MTPELVGALWTFAGTAALAVLGWIGSIIVKRVRPRASEPEMWKRLDELSVEMFGGQGEDGRQVIGLRSRVETAERKFGAAGRVIRDLARQWPSQHVPRLNPADLDELDETTLQLDHPWRVKP